MVNSFRLAYLVFLLALATVTGACHPIVAEPAHQLTTSTMATPVPPKPTPTPEVINQELVAAGRAVYLKNYCGVCHALAAAGTAGVFGPSHEGVGALAASRIADPTYKGGAISAEEYLRESIVAPTVYIAPGGSTSRMAMPPFVQLSADELDALVYFLLQQR